jgi:protein-S-isoprenylcysteine O-methyltransferase Ste14
MLFLRSIFFTFLLPGTITVLIPYWLITSRRGGSSSYYPFVSYLGLPLIVIGVAGLAWCIWDFFSAGQGTLAPIDPPKHLVVRGLYRYVRNPMYIAVVTILLGEAIFFRSSPVMTEAVVFFVLANLFILLYEEPVLRRQFGESYTEYKRATGRWIPRFW